MKKFYVNTPLDRNHPNFSTKLYIAVKAWTDLFGDKNKELPEGSVKDMFLKWLKENNISIRDPNIEITEEEAEKEEFPFFITEDDMYEIGMLMQPDYMYD